MSQSRERGARFADFRQGTRTDGRTDGGSFAIAWEESSIRSVGRSATFIYLCASFDPDGRREGMGGIRVCGDFDRLFPLCHSNRPQIRPRKKIGTLACCPFGSQFQTVRGPRPTAHEGPFCFDSILGFKGRFIYASLIAEKKIFCLRLLLSKTNSSDLPSFE